MVVAQRSLAYERMPLIGARGVRALDFRRQKQEPKVLTRGEAERLRRTPQTNGDKGVLRKVGNGGRRLPPLDLPLKVKNWGVHTLKDGLLITGQNPASSGPAAKVLIDTLKMR
jgi:hypothetical protein